MKVSKIVNKEQNFQYDSNQPLTYLFDIPLYSTVIENNNKYKFEVISEIDDLPRKFKMNSNENEDNDDIA